MPELRFFVKSHLGRTAREVKGVVEAAERLPHRLGVDLSYRHTEAMRQIKALLQRSI
jgi:predicted dehydrogenase